MLKKIIGFVLGFVVALAALIAVAGAMHVMPRGPVWVLLCVAVGLFGARVAASPRQHVEGAIETLKPAARHWWALSPRLRLALVVGGVWALAAYFIQDEYERNLKAVFIPPLALLALHFGEEMIVKRKASGQGPQS